jgi:hypothetical protein
MLKEYSPFTLSEHFANWLKSFADEIAASLIRFL